jgi:tripartite-type tricarboxylate transporter receptor subunit TctC
VDFGYAKSQLSRPGPREQNAPLQEEDTMTTSLRRIAGVMLALALALPALPAAAQTWPTKPVKLILSQPPGSSPDIVARLIADRLSKQWGQSVVVENRPGGQNAIGAQAAAKSPPDGYTFYYGTTAALVINAFTFKSLPYDPRRDFVPVGMIGESPFVVAINPDLPAKNLAEFIDYAKANPDRLAMATEGTKTFSGMMADMFAATAGIRMLHVPYSGVTPGIQDTIANRTQLTVQAAAALSTYLKRDALRPIAVTSAKRVPGLEQVPALGETYPGFQYVGWHAVVAPTGTPAEAIERFNRDLDRVLREPETAKRLFDLGIIVQNGAGTPGQLAAFLRAEEARWGELAKNLRIVPE